MDLNAKIIGLLIGLVFGIVLVWQGAGAAGLVLLFTLVGWLIGFLVWLVMRMMNGDLDPAALRQLMSSITSGRTNR